MKKMSVGLIFSCLVLIAGCAENGYRNFYHPLFDPKTSPLPTNEYKYLGANEQPLIFATNDMDRDIKIARSRYWVPVGYSAFNGAMGSQADVFSQAKAVGAGLVIVTSKFTGNQTTTVPLFIPDNQTTYYNGTTSGQVNDYNGYNASYNANTSGSATTYGTKVVPFTQTQARYDQGAAFFIRYVKKLKFGVALVPLTPELRAEYERNTGALVDIVYEDSPAFIANILPGDIVTEIDGKSVESVPQATSLMVGTPPNSLSVFKIIRNGTEKTIKVQLTN
jgi:serine protease Do